jgi:hypothetical protein
MGPFRTDLTFAPSPDALEELRKAWAWLLPEPFEPLLCSALGDVFLEIDTRGVYWLNTSTGTISRVATSREEFQALLSTESANDFFLPNLISQLRAKGKTLGPGQCYSFVILPIFAEGQYEVSNLYPVAAKEHFSLTGEIHAQLANTRDGTKVEMKTVK